MSTLRSDNIVGRDQQKAPTFPKGATVTGVVTATTFDGNLTGNVTGNVTGNTDTATTLQNSRTIGGVAFDGSANIDLPGVNQIGNQNTAGTAAGLHGTPNITVGTVTGTTGTFSGNVSIAGTLTYEDVKNIDSIGIITARQGINVSAGQVDVGSNIKLNAAAGVVTATSFVGSGANLTSLPAQATIANNADNRLITGGAGVNLNGEANLTFDGNTLSHNATGNSHRIQTKSTGDHYTELRFDANRSASDNALGYINFKWDGDSVADIICNSGADTTNKDDGWLQFRTSPSQGAIAERFRLASNGAWGIQGANYGSSGQVLTSQGSGGAPQWATPSSGGLVQQVVHNSTASTFNSSSNTFVATPCDLTITPLSSSSKIVIQMSPAIWSSSSQYFHLEIRATGGATGVIASYGDFYTYYYGNTLIQAYHTGHNTTSAITYTLWGRSDGQGWYCPNNNSDGDIDQRYAGIAWEVT